MIYSTYYQLPTFNTFKYCNCLNLINYTQIGYQYLLHVPTVLRVRDENKSLKNCTTCTFKFF